MTQTAPTPPTRDSEITIAGRTYMRPERLSEILQVSRRTLQRWHDRRIGPPRITIGLTHLYAADAVTDWLASRQTHPVR